MKVILYLFVAVLIGSSQTARSDTISYGELEAMRSLGMQVRFPNCTGKCERQEITASVTPDQFMQADTLDFGGYRLLKLPNWLFSMSNLKVLRLDNSILDWKDFEKIAQLRNLEALHLKQSTLKNLTIENKKDGKEQKFASVIGKLNRLTILDLEKLDVATNLNKSDQKYLFIDQKFLPIPIARQLVSLNIKGLKSSEGAYTPPTLYSVPLTALEELAGDDVYQFHDQYQDVFTLPRLRVLDGFKFGGSKTNNMVHHRVKNRTKP